jgi:hypothetical protein
MEVFLLPHQAALLRQIELALTEVQITGSSRGVLLIGPSGSGKTYLLDVLAERMPPIFVAGQRRFRVCVVSLGAASDPTSIMRRILAALGKPESVTARIKVADLEWQVLDAMDACGVEILVIEEFHNALLKTDKKLRGQSNRLLKNFWNAENHSKRVILISGTAEIVEVFDGDDELNSRFGARVYAVSLWFDSPEGTRHFRGIAEAIANRHGVLHFAEIKNNIVLARLLFACRGHLRRLDELCARVATLARTEPAVGDPAGIWASAFSQVAAKSEASENPFLVPEEEIRRRTVALRNAVSP